MFHAGGVVVDLPKDALAFMFKSAEVVLAVRVVVRECLARASLNQLHHAGVLGFSFSLVAHRSVLDIGQPFRCGSEGVAA